jgi:hypothetical protein
MSEMADSSLLVSVLREMRGAMRDFRTLCLVTTEAIRRVDRRLDDIERRIGTTGGDIELMLKGDCSAGLRISRPGSMSDWPRSKIAQYRRRNR